MTAKTIYSCNICGEKRNCADLIGVTFTYLDKFKLGSASDTGNIHICKSCCEQLNEQLPTCLLLKPANVGNA